MTLETLYFVSQIVAVIVIIATLLAMLWQGYQTNKIARADLTLNWWMAAGALNQSAVDTNDKAAFMMRVFDPSANLSREDHVRIAFQMHTQVGVFQAAYGLNRRGLVEEAPFALAKHGMSAFMSSAVARAWWIAHRDYPYEPTFKKIMDDVVAEAEAAARAAAAKGAA
jgi:hypothetical protein